MGLHLCCAAKWNRAERRRRFKHVRFVDGINVHVIDYDGRARFKRHDVDVFAHSAARVGVSYGNLRVCRDERHGCNFNEPSRHYRARRSDHIFGPVVYGIQGSYRHFCPYHCISRIQRNVNANGNGAY